MNGSTQDVTVAVGLPVWQGENYLAETLHTLLNQTIGGQLRIIVSDNASTDSTVAIVERAAHEDDRVRLIEQPHNIGAVANYNAVFAASSSDYFWWNAHDDLVSPNYAEAAVEALTANPGAVVAIAPSKVVGPDGTELAELKVPELLFSARPHQRLKGAITGSPAGVVFGVFRSEAVGRSRLHRAYTGSDRTFVAEMMLQGPPARMRSDAWFALREHEGRSVRSTQKTWFSHPREGWFAPHRAGKVVFPNWRRLGDYWTAVGRSRLSRADRLRCYGTLLSLLVEDRGRMPKMLAADLVKAAFTLGAKITRRRSAA